MSFDTSLGGVDGQGDSVGLGGAQAGGPLGNALLQGQVKLTVFCVVAAQVKAQMPCEAKQIVKRLPI